MRIRTTAAVLAALTAGTGWALAGCAPYISTSGNQGPNSGYLLSEMLVTEETSFGVDAGGYVNRTVRVQWSVGHYRMAQGGDIRVDCRTYTQI
jgi:hypothetical protein